MISKYWRKFLIWLTKRRLYKWALYHVIPYIRFTTYYTSMKGSVYHKGYELLKPGDIILTKDKKKLTTILIGGEFCHAAFCVSKNRGFECAEMTHTDYTKSTFADVCFQSDRVVILRCPDFDGTYITKIIKKCKSFEDCKYDTVFKLNNEFLYCSELVYESDFERRLKLDLSDLAGIGNKYISPTGLFYAKNVTVVWDTGVNK